MNEQPIIVFLFFFSLWLFFLSVASANWHQLKRLGGAAFRSALCKLYEDYRNGDVKLFITVYFFNGVPSSAANVCLRRTTQMEYGTGLASENRRERPR